jgi:hypothetical protein
MSRDSTCRCLICLLEGTLAAQFFEPVGQQSYRQFAAVHSLLSAFPAASDLVAHLHARREANNGTHSPDRILGELLQANAANGNAGAPRDLLLLAFIPMLHATARQVAARYASLARDDIGQHATASLLQILGSPEFYDRNSHAAFAISRMLKRSVFEWAERECRALSLSISLADSMDPFAHETTESIERSTLLRHFLDRCHRRGWLSTEDLNILVQFKLDAPRDAKPGGPAALYTNAHRQRMKRLLHRLRQIAEAPRDGKERGGQLRLF